MSTSQLKDLLIQRISEIDDESFLKAIMTILESRETTSDTYMLNEQQRKGIIESKEQFERGESIDHDALFNEIEAWLAKE